MLESGQGGDPGIPTDDCVTGPSAQPRRSSTLNPLFEPEPANAGPAVHTAPLRESDAEHWQPVADEHVGPVVGSTNGASGPLGGAVPAADGSGEVRVRRQSTHPSILRQVTWTEPEEIQRPGAD